MSNSDRPPGSTTTTSTRGERQDLRERIAYLKDQRATWTKLLSQEQERVFERDRRIAELEERVERTHAILKNYQRKMVERDRRIAELEAWARVWTTSKGSP